MVRISKAAYRAVAALFAVCVLGTSSVLSAQQQPPTVGAAPPPSAAEAFLKGLADGDSAAAKVGTGFWVLRGLALSAPIWTIPDFVNSSDVSLSVEQSLRIVNESTAYQQGYREGYGKRLKEKRKTAAFRGAAVGIGLIALGMLVLALGSEH